MKSRVWLPGIEVESKQHSRSYSRTGRTFTNHAYERARDTLGIMARLALTRKGWPSPVETKVIMRMSYRGRFDVDNAAGFVMDALQGVAYVRDSQVVCLTVRKRLDGALGILIALSTIEDRPGRHRPEHQT